MRTLPSILLALASLLLTLPTSAHAADVAFFPVESTNLTPEDASGIGELLAQSYASVSRQSVLAPSRTQDVLAQSATYEQAAQTLGVKEYVRTQAVAVGRRTVVTATRYQTNGGSLAQSKMTLESIEDMTNVGDRMAQALYQRTDDEAVRNPDNVTLAETRAKNRMWTEKVVGFKTGLHAPFAKRADFKNHLSLQFDMRLEAERYFIEFGAGIAMPSDLGGDIYDCDYDYDGDCKSDNQGRLGGLTAELGASYFLTQGTVGVYAGGGVIPRLVFDSERATIAGYAQLGVMLPRTSSTRFYTDIRVSQFALPIELDNGHERYPTEVGLHVGVGW